MTIQLEAVVDSRVVSYWSDIEAGRLVEYDKRRREEGRGTVRGDLAAVDDG